VERTGPWAAGRPLSVGKSKGAGCGCAAGTPSEISWKGINGAAGDPFFLFEGPDPGWR